MAEANSYYPGDLVAMLADITVSGTNEDPTTITFQVVDPYGSVTSHTPTHDSTGNYHFNFDTTGAAPGTWYYTYSGTGAAQGAAAQPFYVQPSVT